MAGISASRKIAFAILMSVERSQAHSDDLLRGNAVLALSAPDKHLATALVLGVLRWQIHLDQQLRALLKHPDAKLDPEVLIAFRLGAFQLLHLDRIPARAVIDESVELTKLSGHRFASGMVNAVLRKLAAAPRSIESISFPAVAAHPHWIVDRWTRFFGEDVSSAICRHNQSQPALTLRLSTPDLEAELIGSGITLSPGEILTAARVVTAGDVTATAAFREGRIRIQDEGSQLVAEIAGHAESILDCCAAPGGKTLILAERNPDAHIVACEAGQQRLRKLRTRLGPLGNLVECRLADATALTYDSEFDLVLADVPCSGTGTLSRNPEIRHRLHPEDLPRQAERQRSILDSVLRALRPGGRLVYSTCSLEPEENEQVVAASLSLHPNIRVKSLTSRIDQMRNVGILTVASAHQLQSSLTPEGYLRLLPGAFGTDGFFTAIIEKLDREDRPH